MADRERPNVPMQELSRSADIEDDRFEHQDLCEMSSPNALPYLGCERAKTRRAMRSAFIVPLLIVASCAYAAERTIAGVQLGATRTEVANVFSSVREDRSSAFRNALAIEDNYSATDIGVYDTYQEKDGRTYSMYRVQRWVYFNDAGRVWRVLVQFKYSHWQNPTDLGMSANTAFHVLSQLQTVLDRKYPLSQKQLATLASFNNGETAGSCDMMAPYFLTYKLRTRRGELNEPDRKLIALCCNDDMRHRLSYAAGKLTISIGITPIANNMCDQAITYLEAVLPEDGLTPDEMKERYEIAREPDL